MGKAMLKPGDIPVSLQGDKVVCRPIAVNCVVFCQDIESLDVKKLGPDFENAPIFPECVNTEFIKVIDRNTLKMRVWERGCGETMACGTGAVPPL